MLQWIQYLQLLFIASPRCGCGSCLQSRIGLHRWWSRHSIEGEPWGRIWGFLMERVLRKVIFRFWCFVVPQYSWGGAGSISKWSVGHTAYPSWAFFQISLGRPHPHGTTWVHPCIWENYSSGKLQKCPSLKLWTSGLEDWKEIVDLLMRSNFFITAVGILYKDIYKLEEWKEIVSLTIALINVDLRLGCIFNWAKSRMHTWFLWVGSFGLVGLAQNQFSLWQI